MTTASRPRPPSVEQVLVTVRARAGAVGRSRDALVGVVRTVLDEERSRLRAGAKPATIDDSR